MTNLSVVSCAATLALIASACSNPDDTPHKDPTVGAVSTTSTGAGGAAAVSASSASSSSSSGLEGGGFESGSRLRANYYLGDDGSKQFTGWHDSMRLEDCAPALASDGALRCLPKLPTSARSGADGAGIFSDAACSIPAITVDPACAAPTEVYVTTSAADQCSGVSTTQTRLFSLGAQIPVGGSYYSDTIAGGQCFAAVVDATANVFKTGPEISPASFVAMKSMTE